MIKMKLRLDLKEYNGSYSPKLREILSKKLLEYTQDVMKSLICGELGEPHVEVHWDNVFITGRSRMTYDNQLFFSDE